MSADPHWASGVCAGLHAAGSRHVVYVPDNPLSHVLRILRGSFPDVRTTLATREEEAFGIAAGLYSAARGRP
jgi:sulfopyruvate decarboxylase TPP-binding subunit